MSPDFLYEISVPLKDSPLLMVAEEPAEYNVKNDLGFSNEFSEETLSKMQQTENMLITVSKLAKEVEWLLSGDTGEDTFKENFDKIMNETDNFRKK